MKKVLLGAVVMLLCAVSSVSAGGVEDTWRKRIEVQPQGVTGPVPVVVYVHGCNGYGPGPGAMFPDTDSWAKTVTGSGYRFLIPDSWARGTWSRPNLSLTGSTLGVAGQALGGQC